MRNNRNLLIVISIAAILLVVSTNGGWLTYSQQTPKANSHILVQSSPIEVLYNGLYNGSFAFGDLKTYGDFGIGTINNLDGEMLELDGTFYNIKSNGIVYVINDTMKTPFAFVTFFKSNENIHLTGPMNYTQLDSYLDSYIPSINGIYAIKIHGTFSYIKARSPTAQKQPYPPLQEALKNQSIFIFHNITGTGIGFRFPTYMADINTIGYHFHFIDDGRSAGGHMLECTIQNSSVEIDYISQFHMLVLNDNSSLVSYQSVLEQEVERFRTP